MKNHLLTGDLVIFKNVDAVLAETTPKIITKINPYTFTIDFDTTHVCYDGYGFVESAKISQNILFKSFTEAFNSVKSAEIAEIDWNIEKLQLLNLGWRAIKSYQKSHGHFPRNSDEVIVCIAILRSILDTSEDFKINFIDENIISNMAKHANSQISQINSIFGGIVSQEVVKFTGKFMPIHQWLHFDFFEIFVNSTSSETATCDNLSCIIGQENSEKLKSLRIFLIGAGTVANEFLKICALSGIATNGEITIADDNQIKTWNLGTDFLVDVDDIGNFKSDMICKKIKVINPEINLKSYRCKVDKSTQELFNDNV